MKIKKLVLLYIFLFIFLSSNSFSKKILGGFEEIKIPNYNVKVRIRNSDILDWAEYCNSEYGKKNPVPPYNEILVEVAKRFLESIEVYKNLNNTAKEMIPICLSQGLDRWLFTLLRKDKSPNASLNIYWRVSKPYTDIEAMKIGEVYRCSWYLIAKGLEPGGGDSPFDAGRIELKDAFREFYNCDRSNHTRHKTASIMFHELIHEVKKAIPECFNKLSRTWEEVTTEDVEVIVFGKDAGNAYEVDGINPKGYDATCKRVCNECGDCPKCIGNN